MRTCLYPFNLRDGAPLYLVTKTIQACLQVRWNINLPTKARKALMQYFLTTQKIFLQQLSRQKIILAKHQKGLCSHSKAQPKNHMNRVISAFLPTMMLPLWIIAGFAEAGG